MIALWLAYATLLAALLAGAAAALDAIARLGHRPARGVWALAVVAATLVPGALLVRTALRPDAAAASTTEAASASTLPVITIPAADTTAPALELGWLDTPLLASWALASLLVLGALLRSAVELRRRRHGWRRTAVDGVPVLVAPDTGPAVIGVRRPEIVLPDWTLSLEPGLRALILRHETEHLRARDARLLLMATLALVLQPLNPVLWWLHRRLRLAVELDCDRRVLAAHGDVERYGLLLLAVGQRATRSLPPLAPTLAEPTPLLERRIDAMSESLRSAGHGGRPARTLVRAVAAGAAALVAIVAACETPTPTHVLTPDDPASARVAAEPTTTGPDQSFFEFQVEQPVEYLSGPAPRYPAALRAAGVSGSVMAQYVVDTLGLVDTSTFKVIQSSHDEFTESVRQTLPELRFKPALVGDRKVKQLVQQPFNFDLGTSARTGAAAGTAKREGVAPSVAPVAPGPVGMEAMQVTPAVYLSGEDAKYPAELRAAGVEGKVVAQFVVGTDGVPMPGTLKIVSSTDPRFDAAVAAAVPTLRFRPAMSGDRAVRQLIEQPFEFSPDR